MTSRVAAIEWHGDDLGNVREASTTVGESRISSNKAECNHKQS